MKQNGTKTIPPLDADRTLRNFPRLLAAHDKGSAAFREEYAKRLAENPENDGPEPESSPESPTNAEPPTWSS
jgi:hypothetical protein